jgi:hypothetical protein
MENSKGAIKQESIGDSVSDEVTEDSTNEIEDILPRRNCLTFTEGTDINHVKEFLHFKRSDDVIQNAWIFSSSYDLNGDGKDEYFYYIEHWPRFCGTAFGCPIQVYEYINGKFRTLFKFDLITNFNFDPKKPEHAEYLCIENETDFGWKRLSLSINIGNVNTVLVYNGTEYIGKLLKEQE